MRNSTTADADKEEHLLRFKCVSLAVCGIESNASSVIRVCATSKCVRCGSNGRSLAKVDAGRIVHSCKLSLVIGSADGSGPSKAAPKESRNVGEEQAQKSRALIFGSAKRALNTSAERSSSMCSCAKNSLRFGVRLRHFNSVAGIKFRVCALSRAVWPAPVGLKWEKSSRRTTVPNAGCSEM